MILWTWAESYMQWVYESNWDIHPRGEDVCLIPAQVDFTLLDNCGGGGEDRAGWIIC